MFDDSDALGAVFCAHSPPTFAQVASHRLVSKTWTAACAQFVVHLELQFWIRLRELGSLLSSGTLQWKSGSDLLQDVRACHFIRRLLMYKGKRMELLNAGQLYRALDLIDVSASTSFDEAKTKVESLIEFEADFLKISRCFSDGFYRDMYFGVIFVFQPELYKPAQTFNERRTSIEDKYKYVTWKQREKSLNQILRKLRPGKLLKSK